MLYCGESHARDGGRRNCVLVVACITLWLAPSLVSVAEATRGNSVAAQAIPRMVQLMCSRAHDRKSCESTLAAHPDAATVGPQGIAAIGIDNALGGVGSFYTFTTSLRSGSNGPGEDAALSTCQSVLLESQDELKDSLTNLGTLNPLKFKEKMADTLTWMSSALTDHMTCLDGVEDTATGGTKVAVMSRAGSVTTLLSNAVSLVASLSSFGFSSDAGGHHNRRLLTSSTTTPVDSPIYKLGNDDFPEWMRPANRKLLQAGDTNNLTIVDAVVAQDGSGNFQSIQAAIDAAPQNNANKWVILAKAGVYSEYVLVPKSAKNLVLMGEGIGKTIITGSKSVVGSNITTFGTATMAVKAEHFLGRDFTVRNTAGAINHQAVALKVQGDKSAFWKCSFEGYQDTLYAHSNRQFYKDCTIYGTVDFVFGNAAAVFQSCTLLARAPLPGQQNTFTAQGRTISSQNTGLSFQNSVVDAAPDLINLKDQAVKSYLGRPWKEYSRTVFLTSTVTDVISPEGWLPWNGDFALSTLFYGEYKNSGTGSGTGGRVKWSTQIQDANVANQFTVNPFITGAEWLPQTTIVYSPQLYS